jgi:hypothetical protein
MARMDADCIAPLVDLNSCADECVALQYVEALAERYVHWQSHNQLLALWSHVEMVHAILHAGLVVKVVDDPVSVSVPVPVLVHHTVDTDDSGKPLGDMCLPLDKGGRRNQAGLGLLFLYIARSMHHLLQICANWLQIY